MGDFLIEPLFFRKIVLFVILYSNKIKRILFFASYKRVSRMFDFLSQKFSSIFSGLESAQKLTESNIQEALGQVQEALLEADVPYSVVQTFIASVKNDVIGREIVASLKPSEQLLKVVQTKIVEFLGGDDASF